MKKITINNVRNIRTLEFEMPLPGLHIVTGKNGTGKTTLFTCISRICNSNAYRQGFPATNNGLYDIISGAIIYAVDDNRVSYSRRSSGRWEPNKRNTTVLADFGYPQVCYITTKGDRVFSQEAINPRRNNSPDMWLNEKLNTIFDTNKFSAMIRITTGDLRYGRGTGSDHRRRNIAYAIPLGNRQYYTEQNFSFGEIVMLNLLHDVKNTVNGSLILIDELELALHPSAQIRLITCLRDLAIEKGLTIIISTHSASIIKSQNSVILLEQNDDAISVLYRCPPAKAIGAIGMREDTMPDIIVLVEDKMAKCLFHALKQRYNALQTENSYLDIRILEIGGFSNVINFFVEAVNYVFYDNIYVTAYMDKDVQTDIIPYDRFGNQNLMRQYRENSFYLRFLPYTPEVLLVKTFITYKNDILTTLSSSYDNQQLHYSLFEELDFHNYEADFPDFPGQKEYNDFMEIRGQFRNKCKKESERIANLLADQLNEPIEVIYRIVYMLAVERIPSEELNIRAFFAQTMKRLRG